MNSKIGLFGLIALAVYVVYLVFGALHFGRLSVEVTDELTRLQCRPECKLWKFKGIKPTKKCLTYCDTVR